ncbi:gp436 family protein [Halocynthiibacter styelae]|uniref:DUF1320 domain-containing protein n=1 Tax=Halocynthiibacter styelae TaxID=2761955 RepID=A0A8J7IL68_9RHOB|nr:DUF1320 domain-containing protein [Paenihalocynthiibacter styelae]MBI1495398.1 DUF1320 domain-containing protein [Paenihalocynthiibacter styelae]
MQYATRSDIVNIYGAEYLEDLTPVDVADPQAAVDQALDDASAEIDGYLSARYDLPLPRQPRLLRRPCVDIAAYILANAHTRLTDTMEKRYDQAISFLTKIAAGKAGLGADEPDADLPATGSVSSGEEGLSFSARPRRFGRNR